MKIEHATFDKLDEITALYRHLFQMMANLQPDYWQAVEPQREFLAHMLNKESSAIFVALNEQKKVTGFILCQEQETPPYPCYIPHRFAYILDLIVDENTRGQGIGSALIDSVIKWAKQRKLDYVDLNVLAENNQAVKLYTKHGFVKNSLILRKKI